MSEHSLIEREMLRIQKAREDREIESQNKIEEKRRQEVPETQRIGEIRELSERFVNWAEKNDIPKDVSDIYAPSRHASLFSKVVRNLTSSPHPAWTIAAIEEHSGDSNANFRPAEELAVDSSYCLFTRTGVSQWGPIIENSRLLRFEPPQIYHTVAKLCIDYGLEWDI